MFSAGRRKSWTGLCPSTVSNASDSRRPGRHRIEQHIFRTTSSSPSSLSPLFYTTHHITTITLLLLLSTAILPTVNTASNDQHDDRAPVSSPISVAHASASTSTTRADGAASPDAVDVPSGKATIQTARKVHKCFAHATQICLNEQAGDCHRCRFELALLLIHHHHHHCDVVRTRAKWSLLIRDKEMR